MEPEQAIRERAYFLWLDGGSVHGNADAHWLAAEAEIVAASMETVARLMTFSETAQDNEPIIARSKTKRRSVGKGSSVSGGPIRRSSAPRKNDKRSRGVPPGSLN